MCEAAKQVKSTHLIKLFLKTRKKMEKISKLKKFFHESHLRDRLDAEFTANAKAS